MYTKAVTDLLNIEYPVIQGAMSRISTAPLVSAVSEAGGLGVLTSVGFEDEDLRKEIQAIKNTTDKPFAVNLMLQQPNIKAIVDTLINEGVKVVTTGAGTPKPYMDQLKSNDVTVISVVASVYHAKKMEDLGVDILVAEGNEAGGHIGTTNTFSLIPQIVDAVSIPVVGAGGVYDNRSVKAMEALGASGIQAGTIFLATTEAPIGDNYKQALIDASDTSTVVTGYKLGHPVRGLANELTTKYSELEYSSARAEELEKLTVGSNPRAIYVDDMENSSVLAGQVSGQITEITSVENVIKRLFSESE